MSTASAFGAIGGAIGGAKLAMMRFVYAIDTEDNTLILVEPDILEDLMFENSDLLEKYKNEADYEAEEVLIQYMNLLNERYKEGSNR